MDPLAWLFVETHERVGVLSLLGPEVRYPHRGDSGDPDRWVFGGHTDVAGLSVAAVRPPRRGLLQRMLWTARFQD